MRRTFLTLLMTTTLALAAGCATVPLPAERNAAARAAVRVAEEMGARDVPPAQLHLQLAYEALAHAQRLIRDGDNQAAAVSLARAEADAELAVALAREHKLHVEAQQAADQVRALQSAPGT